MTETLKGTHVSEVNVDEIECSDDDTTGRGGGAPSALRETFVALRFSGECGGGVRQWRCLLVSAEGQDVVHRSTRMLLEPMQQADMSVLRTSNFGT